MCVKDSQYTHRHVFGSCDDAWCTVGAYLTAKVSTHAIASSSEWVLLYSAYASLRKRPDTKGDATPDALAAALKMYRHVIPMLVEKLKYTAQKVPAGFSLSSRRGTLSGLLGIGIGA